MSAEERAGGAAADGGVLGRRALGRALLARQHLLERTTATPAAMIEHLGGLQAQAVPQPPYLGLLSRLDGFAPEALTELIESRRVVRIALQRGTIHLVTAEDCLTLRPLLQPVLDKALRATFGKWLVDLDLDALAAEARTLVEEQPRTFQLLGTELAATRPDRDPAALAQAARALLPLVQVPPRGLWGRSGAAAHTTAEAWLGRPLDPEPSIDDLALRYLAAFGPATAADLQKWCGLSRLAPVLKRLAPRLVTFRDEHGRLLHDLPEAPRPDPDTPAPVRLLAPFDNLLLSHADRTRVLPEEYRPRVMTQNGLVLGTLLVDGLVAGSWRLAEERSGARSLTVRPFGPQLDPSDRRAALAEAERVLAFAGGDGEVRFEAAG
ncbi:winged helix DNA-binding domain-containing protein [Kitasatospora purpeofusca]|uniref:Winged helix DNA-binding domain-containing protein n=1 Tax=Kitasatospora purpeofusca TaxID=67352 RepID=A0ABZ1U9F1_9ACTN|nr:winged helix DNA-binding domain-containing protein [Kitasatospora purpeofusca]